MAGIPKSAVSLTIPPDSLRKLPSGSSYHSRNGQAGLTVKSGATRTFKPSNRSAWQAVTQAAGDDADATDTADAERVAVRRFIGIHDVQAVDVLDPAVVVLAVEAAAIAQHVDLERDARRQAPGGGGDDQHEQAGIDERARPQ